VGDFLLLGVLILNLCQLFRIQTATKAILDTNILSDNPDKFIALINASGVSWQVWLVNVSSIIITAIFVILLFIPKFQVKKLAVTNAIWLGVWLLYVVVSLIIVAVVVMSFLSFT